MDGQPTRAGRTWVPAEWRRLGAYLRHPVLPPRATLSVPGTARAVPALLALDMALMALVLGGIGVAVSLGLKLPGHLLDGIDLTPKIVLALVVAAPIAEETAFRGWVSGRPGHILAVIALLAGIAGMILLGDPIAKASAAGLGLILAAILLYVLRRYDALAWFARHFRWFFYGSAVLFAAIHLTNFAAAGSGAAFLTPLVIPQFVLGLFLAYLRVNRGLWSSMSLHMLHNAVFVGLMLAGAR